VTYFQKHITYTNQDWVDIRLDRQLFLRNKQRLTWMGAILWYVTNHHLKTTRCSLYAKEYNATTLLWHMFSHILHITIKTKWIEGLTDNCFWEINKTLVIYHIIALIQVILCLFISDSCVSSLLSTQFWLEYVICYWIYVTVTWWHYITSHTSGIAILYYIYSDCDGVYCIIVND